MDENSSIRYYFSDDEALKRVFVVYGNTTDHYQTASRSYKSFDDMLTSHLHYMGYQMVLIYRGGNVLECLDESSRELIDRYFPPEGKKKTMEESTEEVPPAAKKPSGGLSGFGRPKKTAAKEEKKEDPKPDLRVEINRYSEIPAYLDRVMRDKRVKSCIVFTNCWNLLERSQEKEQNAFNQDLAAHMQGWFGLDETNSNIAVLLFSEPRLDTLDEFLRNNTRWSFLREYLFSNGKFSDSVIRIGNAQEDEIRYLLQMEFSGPDNPPLSVLQQAAAAVIQEGNGKLRALRKYLYSNRHLSETERAEKLLSEYGPQSREDALERLRTTPGWEEVYNLVKRLIAEHESHQRPEEDYAVESETNLRMASEWHRSGQKVNMNIMLKGNPGTGKTTVTEWIGKALQQKGLLRTAAVHKVSKQDIEGKYVGHTAAQTQEHINMAMGGVLFVDEAYSLFHKDEGTTGHVGFGQDAIDVFVDQMTTHQGDLAIIFAGYPKEMETFMSANSGLNRRFGNNIVTIPDYTPDILEAIALDSIQNDNNKGAAASAEELRETGRIQYDLDSELIFHEDDERRATAGPSVTAAEAKKILAETRKSGKPLPPLSLYFDNWYADRDRATFGNAGAALILAESLRTRARERTKIKSSRITINALDFPPDTDHLFICRKPSLEEIRKQLEDVIGMEDVKESLYRTAAFLQLTEIQNKRKAALHHTNKARVAPGHYLFIGNPGTGKTMISEKLALTLSGLGIIDRYEPTRMTGLELINIISRGNGIDDLKKRIEACVGGVLVIDEAHQLTEAGAGRAVVMALLDPMITKRTEMSFIFCCYPEKVKAFLAMEPGLSRRISQIMRFADYSPDEMLEILMIKAKKQGYIISEECSALILQAIKEIKAAGRAQNGGTSEKLLENLKIAIGSRLSAMYDNDFQKIEESLSGTDDSSMLYTVCPEDVDLALKLLAENDIAEKG